MPRWVPAELSQTAVEKAVDLRSDVERQSAVMSAGAVHGILHDEPAQIAIEGDRAFVQGGGRQPPIAVVRCARPWDRRRARSSRPPKLPPPEPHEGPPATDWSSPPSSRQLWPMVERKYVRHSGSPGRCRCPDRPGPRPRRSAVRSTAHPHAHARRSTDTRAALIAAAPDLVLALRTSA